MCNPMRNTTLAVQGRPPASRACSVSLSVAAMCAFGLVAGGCSEDAGTTPKASKASKASASRNVAAPAGAAPFIPLSGTELEVSHALRRKGYNAKALDGHVVSVTASKEASDLHRLKEFPKLEQVNLNNTTLVREQLAQVSELSQLKSLGLSRTNVQDDWLPELSGLQKLESLYLSETQITNRGVEHLKAFPKLKMVNLNQTPVTDEAMPRLAELPSLETLYLFQTSLTDAGLVHLQASKSLKKLFVNSTKVTKQGIEKFRQAVPDCEIVDE